MDLSSYALLALVFGMIVLFLTEYLPVELTALLGLCTLVLGRYITPAEAFTGFSSPTVVTLVAMFVIGAALRETGVADRIASRLQRFVGTDEKRCVIVAITIGAFFSAFMNNVAASALLLPGILGLAQRTRVPPSLLLIPLSFGVLLGGMTTLIGTSPNLLISQTLADAGRAPFHFFDFTIVGLGIALSGGFVLATWGWKLLPRHEHTLQRGVRDDLLQLYRLYDRVFSVRIPRGSSMAGRSLASVKFGSALGAQVIAIVRGGKRRFAPQGSDVLEGGDVLVLAGTLSDLAAVKTGAKDGAAKALIAGEEQDIEDLRHLGEVEIVSENVEAEFESLEVGISEVVLSPRSSLIGRTLREVNFRERYGFQVLGIWRASESIGSRLGNVLLQFGDALLLHGPRERVRTLEQDRDFVVLNQSDVPVIRVYSAVVTVLAFILMIGLSIFEFVPLEVAALLAACVVLLFRGISMQQAYREIEWKIVLFLGAILPLGAALEKSGVAAAFSSQLVGWTEGIGPWGVIITLSIIASLISQALDGAPAVIFLSPIALRTADAMNFDPHPLMLAIALSASIAFLTPFSHKAHLLVMNPGGYRSSDYFRIGLLTTVVCFAALFAGIALFIDF